MVAIRHPAARHAHGHSLLHPISSYSTVALEIIAFESPTAPSDKDIISSALYMSVATL